MFTLYYMVHTYYTIQLSILLDESCYVNGTKSLQYIFVAETTKHFAFNYVKKASLYNTQYTVPFTLYQFTSCGALYDIYLLYYTL